MTRLEFDEKWLEEYQKRTGCRVTEYGKGADRPAGQEHSRQGGSPEVGRGSRPTKYKNEPTIQDGKRYASRREAKRARELKALRRAGEIFAFAEQVAFELPGGIRYIADFVILQRDGRFRIEDSKGVQTKEYRLKKRLMAAQGLTIEEV